MYNCRIFKPTIYIPDVPFDQKTTGSKGLTFDDWTKRKITARTRAKIAMADRVKKIPVTLPKIG